MISNTLTGAGYLFRGFNLIIKPGLRQFVLIPLLINTLFFGLAVVYGASWFNVFVDWLLPGWLEWLSWFLWILFYSCVLLFTFYIFTIFANLFASPFNGLLSEKVEEYLAGKRPEKQESWHIVIKGLIPSIWSEIKKLLYFTLWSFPFLLIFLIPGVNILAPVIWFVFSGWMLTLEYLDYPMSNNKISFKELRKKLKEKPSMAFGFGWAVILITMIPLVNFMAIPAAVAGATIMWVENWKPEKK